MTLAYALVFVMLSIVGIYYYIFNSKKVYNLPPGPLSLFPRKLQSYLTYQNWAKKFGPIFRTKFGFWNCVILDDPKLISLAFNNPVISDRIDHKVFGVIGGEDGGHRGIINANGKEWSEQRRFVLRTLRDFGFGKEQTMETFIMQEVNEILKWMKQNEDIPTSMDKRFVLATVNTLWTLIAGKRFEQDNEIVEEMGQKATRVFLETLGNESLLLSYPQLIDIVPKSFFPKWALLLKKLQPFRQIFQDAIDHHIQNPADEGKPRDLIDSYLTEIIKTENPESSFYKQHGSKFLLTAVADLYTAGQGTTSVTLNWSVLYLIKFPHVQQKFQRELDKVVGRNRLPSLVDRPKLVYTTALMNEILRYSSIVPLGVFHKVTEDTTLDVYDLKKGTVVIPNLYSVHYRKELWEDPENFRPERFLSHDEQKIVKTDNLIPFSVGKRQCLGESLARDNFFLFLTNIFHRFNLEADPTTPEPSLEPIYGFLREPQKFQMIIQERQF